ncbi:MAG: acetylxylan esterase [Bryobacteraceae bacterium]|nr:acetylxylan esterase [Bryobacteraceae bacterium]
MSTGYTRREWFRTLGSAALIPSAAGAGQLPQPSPAPPAGAPPRGLGDVMFEKYLAREVAKLEDRFLGGAATLEKWQASRLALRREFFDMIGLWPLPEKTPLHANVIGAIEGDGFVVEKLHFQSWPGLYVTANLWRPREVKEKAPAVLLFVGHYNRGRNGHKGFMQDQGKWFARNGYVCLIMDTLTRGELPGIHLGLGGEPPKLQARWWWIARGYHPAGIECWNAIRGIDYLVSRPEVDAGRIGATGLSGGGAVTFWIAAVDDRVKAAAAHSGMGDWENLVMNWNARLHCDCMFPYNAYGWELTTVGALIAPTPFLFVDCHDDIGFPLASHRRIAERLRRIYRMYGREDSFQSYVTQGPIGAHSYTPDSRTTIFRWINRHLKGDAGEVADVDDVRIPEEDLRAFPTDDDIPKGFLNNEIDRRFVSKAQVPLPATGNYDAWRNKLLSGLRDLSFRTFPERIPPADKAPRLYRYTFVEWERETGVQVRTTESGLQVYLALHGLVSNAPPRDRLVTLVVVNEGDPLDTLPDWAARSVEANEPYAILTPRGVGPTAWTEERMNFVPRAHLCVGRTVDQGRVWDIAAVARNLNGDGPVKVVGRGRSGILGAYAALFEPAIREVVAVEPPASHEEGPIFLNVLRVLDIPDALGMLAPKALTLENAEGAAFDKTLQIYRLAGAGDRLRRL